MEMESPMTNVNHTSTLKIQEIIYALIRLGTTQKDYECDYSRTYSILLSHMLSKVNYDYNTQTYEFIEYFLKKHDYPKWNDEM
jgi:hypothetical protein